ncbi:MAG TPA: glycosyltransferase family 4 protein [Gammaproteobacteria bacterium]|nr:glycosyltransferase family 4 protein [Gammaproteobacteria bacterium]
MQGNDNLRLLMITELFLPTKGGTAVSFDDDFRRLGGKEVHVITADVPGAAEFDRNHPNTIHRLVLKRWEWLKPESLLIYTKLFWKSLWLALTTRTTAIFAGRALPEGMVALIVGRLTRRPVLIYAHGEELTGWGRGRKFQAMCFTMRRADWILSNSDNTRDTLVNLLGVDSDRIALTYPTVDEKRFYPAPPDDELRCSIGVTGDKKLILSVGRLQLRKGFDSVIRSLPALLEQGLNIEYALIGIGDELHYLQELASEFNVTEHVHFLGHVSYEDLPRWYHACDLFAMPNRDIDGDNEGFGLVFLEAAASSKPAIAGRAGGTDSAVIDGETGLLVDGEKIKDIVAAIGHILRNPEESSRMGNTARQRVLENFIHKRRVDQLRDLVFRKR